MKKIKQKKSFMLLLSLLITTLSLINSQNSSIPTFREAHINQFDEFDRLKTSSSWNFTSLIIDDTGASGNFTWEEAVLEDWCSGLGTEGSPYILNDIVFGSKTTDYALEIRNSTAYFQINNTIISYIHDLHVIGWWDVGIRLINCSNGYLSNNYFLDVNYSIYLENANFTTITDNRITFGIDGISLINSHHNVINNNNITNLDDMAINVWDSSYNVMTGNILNSNGLGIFLTGQYNTISQNFISESSTGMDIMNNYTTISGNVISNCGHGVDISGSSHLITENTLEGNQIGLKFWWKGKNNIVSKNVISGNEDYGVVFQSEYNLSIINNYISGGDEGAIVLDGESYELIENVTIGDNIIDESFILCIYGKSILIAENIGSVKIRHCEDVLVTVNELIYSPLGHGGQFVQHCTNISISNNIYKESFLWFDYCHNSTIKDNLFQFTELILSDSSYNVITRNNINADQYSYAIDLKTNSNYNNITNNVITFENGGCFKQDETCTGNVFENNDCRQRLIGGFEVLILLSIAGLISLVAFGSFRKKVRIIGK